MPSRKPLTIDAETGKPDPLPRSDRRLATVRDVRIALAGLYRDARTGKVDTQDATRLGYLLNLIRVCIVDGELEARMTALEENMPEVDQ
jgi:hypothetical protein